MDISKETYKSLNTDSKLNTLFDMNVALAERVQEVHDCMKSDNGEGYGERLRNVEKSLGRLKKVAIYGSGVITAVIAIIKFIKG